MKNKKMKSKKLFKLVSLCVSYAYTPLISFILRVTFFSKSYKRYRKKRLYIKHKIKRLLKRAALMSDHEKRHRLGYRPGKPNESLKKPLNKPLNKPIRLFHPSKKY